MFVKTTFLQLIFFHDRFFWRKALISSKKNIPFFLFILMQIQKLFLNYSHFFNFFLSFCPYKTQLVNCHKTNFYNFIFLQTRFSRLSIHTAKQNLKLNRAIQIRKYILHYMDLNQINITLTKNDSAFHAQHNHTKNDASTLIKSIYSFITNWLLYIHQIAIKNIDDRTL